MTFIPMHVTSIFKVDEAKRHEKQQLPKRNAGILLHISSLDSPFGVGDFGHEARVFADFLHNSGQQYWQILPLNPTESRSGHCPYESYSAFGGNTLLISPELLVEQGLLNAQDVENIKLPNLPVADFEQAEKLKNALFEKAFQNYCNSEFNQSDENFESFCAQEQYWLDDFALFVILKRHLENAPWYQWPDKYKSRDKVALDEFVDGQKLAIKKVKWLQYIFSDQWKSLRAYCNGRGIKLFGDLPFYVSYDSVDVWANPELFSLNEKGELIFVAGVPPDYFNDEGQRWGMPVFEWEKHRSSNYAWWCQRIKKNMEHFDLLRLDHFRAFSDYWQVAASEPTAIKGTWEPGPRMDFFNAIKSTFGELPFIAEDLGDIDQAVHQLREKTKLPGMRVVQFAFGEGLPISENIPHNYDYDCIAYTGTHDNNTCKGWFRQDALTLDKARLNAYASMEVTEANVHEVLAKMVYASVAQTAILPMQDVLGLDESARMNIPATTKNNWLWRMLHGACTKELQEKLLEWCLIYNR